MAYGTNAPFGLRPIESLIGNGSSGVISTYKIASATTAGVVYTYDRSIFKGDVVYYNAHIISGLAPNPPYAGAGTIATIADKLADTYPVGVFLGCEYYNSANVLTRSDFWPANTLVFPNTSITAFVNDDPMAIFEVQVSTSQNGVAAAPILQAAFGQNANLNIGGGTGLPVINPTAGNTVTGVSGYYLDLVGILNTATLPFRIMGYSTSASQFHNIFDNAGVVRSFLTVRVKFNGHALGSVGTLGTVAA